MLNIQFLQSSFYNRNPESVGGRPHGSDDVDIDSPHESSPPLGCIRLPYKRPFYTLALHQHEVEQVSLSPRVD